MTTSTTNKSINQNQLKEDWGHIIDAENLELVSLEQVQLDPDNYPEVKVWLYTYKALVVDKAEMDYQWGEVQDYVYIVGSGDRYSVDTHPGETESSFWDFGFDELKACYVSEARIPWF